MFRASLINGLLQRRSKHGESPSATSPYKPWDETAKNSVTCSAAWSAQSTIDWLYLNESRQHFYFQGRKLQGLHFLFLLVSILVSGQEAAECSSLWRKTVKNGGLGPIGTSSICPIQELCECFSDVGDIYTLWKISGEVGKRFDKRLIA